MTKYPRNKQDWPAPPAGLPWHIGGKIAANFFAGDTPMVSICLRLNHKMSFSNKKVSQLAENK
jgi:hypothetical protein